MDNRKLRLILLGIVGVIILVIGVGAANIYNKPGPAEIQRDYVARTFYGKRYSQLDDSEKIALVSLNPYYAEYYVRSQDLAAKNYQFEQWLLKWIVRPVGLFAILTAALVASRLIVDKIRPPSTRS